MKGIILAGGAGTRLHPVTQVTSKQLLPVYDKPMIYYPLSILMLAGVRDILIITTPDDQFAFRKLLGDGGQWGVNLTYAVQSEPNGLAQAYVIGAQFVGNDASILILGDNIFYGGGMSNLLRMARESHNGATVFAYRVSDPERYGVATFDEEGYVKEIVEKPSVPKSNWAVTGLYMYDSDVVQIVRSLRPSARGEYEITDVNKEYLAAGRLRVERMGRGYAWLDAGTHVSLLESSSFIHSLEERQGLKIGCLEEIAYRQGYIGPSEIEEAAALYGSSGYGNYLRNLLNDRTVDPREILI